MTHPFVSIIVPIYNVEMYLRGCLDSLLNQTFKDFEVIMVDDGATDSSGAIADEYAQKDERFSVIHQKNKGLSGARNTGLQVAKGDYISFLDSDDYFHPDFLKLMMKVAQNEQTDVVFCNLAHTTSLYQKIPAGLKLNDFKLTRFFKPFTDFLKEKSLITQVCVKLYKKSVLGDLTFKEGIYFEDVLFTTLFMGRAKNAVHINAPLYYYYTNPNSIMHTAFNEKKVMSYIQVIEEVYAYTQKHHPDHLNLVQQEIINKRVKMTMNQALRKQKDKEKCLNLFQLMGQEFKRLYQNKIISFEGLKLKHKIALFFLLRGKEKIAFNTLKILPF